MPYSTAFNTLPPSVDCSILTMKSESLLSGKAVGPATNETAAHGQANGAASVKVKAEGTIIKNFQSHNVHFQHFMK